MVSDVVSCPLPNLKTVWNILMILYSYVEQIMTMCRIQKMATLAVIFLVISLDHFRWNFVSALQLEYPLEYNHDTSQLCRTGHDDVSRTRMTVLAFIVSELFPLDGFRCNYVSAP